MSDNLARIEEKIKLEDEVIRKIFDKKDKNRKAHNVSVTTNTSTNTTTSKKPFNYYS